MASAIVKNIKAPVAEEMKIFEEKFRSSMDSKVPLLNRITHYIVKRKGKQMRPMFVFLSAKVCGGVTESSYNAASLIELLHTATLVHDDVVDDANLRRGFFSINALWKNKIAVLVGDFLLSKGLLLSVENEEFEMLKLVSEAVKEMSEGELLQIEKARKLDITEEVYFDVIRQKTASLIAACCASGAKSAGVDDLTVLKMKKFGEKVGMAFQIKDDIFDYGTGENIGKPTGIDIKERKMTLPLIYTMNKVDKATNKKIRKIIKKHNEEPVHVKYVIDQVISNGGLDYAHEQMMNYTKEALDIIADFEDSDAKNSLIQLVKYTTERTK
ncbi:MAG: octaprenyl-diphosphate synthase [Parvicellaceae bacterium]|jgi:octaprenyl-diphosphate synthase